MQKFSRLVSLHPGPSLAAMPDHVNDDEAESVLANWTALWHPQIIAAAGSIPVWHPAEWTFTTSRQQADWELEQSNAGDYWRDDFRYDDSDGTGEEEPDQFNQEVFDESWSEAVIAISSAASPLLQDGFLAAAGDRKSTLIVGANDRIGVLNQLGVDPTGDNEDLSRDFFALGYALMQTQLMTLRLRESTNLDMALLGEIAVGAARASIDGDKENARVGISRCFDLLAGEKNDYYPVVPDLIDIVLLAETTVGASLTRQLNQNHPVSFQMTGAVARKIAADSPNNARPIRERIEQATASVCGGSEHELPISLLGTETFIRQLLRSRETHQEIWGGPVDVFLRRRGGLSQAMPRLLEQTGFRGAVHASLDGTPIPDGTMGAIRWAGADGGSILALTETPIDASEHSPFLDLGVRIGQQLDSSHMASMLFAHWPDRMSDSFQDCLRTTRYGTVLGKLKTLGDYFESAYDPGYDEPLPPEEYGSRLLEELLAAKSPRPVSAFVQYWNASAQLQQCQSLIVMIACDETQADQNHPYTQWADTIEQLAHDIDNNTLNLDREINHAAIKQRLAELTGVLTHAYSGSTDDSSATMLINATGSPRTMRGQWTGSGSGTHATTEPLVMIDARGDDRHGVATVPAMGQLSLGNFSDSPGSLAKDPFVDEANVLRNEFFSVNIDRDSGAIRSVNLHSQRGNLFSQQLAIRIPKSSETNASPRYTTMVCQSSETKRTSKLSSEITSRGQLMDGDAALANFEWTIRVTRGIRTIDVSATVTPLVQFDGSPGHYLCVRSAWPDEVSQLFRIRHGVREFVSEQLFESPELIEIVNHQHSISLFSQGLPFHRRASRKKLDTILMIGAEQERSFRWSIGVDVESPARSARHAMLPSLLIHGSKRSLHQPDWLFHIANRNIMATWWEPVWTVDCRCIGVSVRLQETRGRSGLLKIYSTRKIESAERVNFLGELIEPVKLLPEHPDMVATPFAGNELFQLKILFLNDAAKPADDNGPIV